MPDMRKTLRVRKTHSQALLLTKSLQALFFLGFFLFLAFFLSRLPVEGGEIKEESPVDLCRLQKDFSFFTGKTVPVQKAEPLSCADLLATRDALTMSDPEKEASRDFITELASILSDSPMLPMVPTIATFDREIAGLIVGIGKKESNWGEHTPKLGQGDECYNFWGYRGAGDRGFTPSGYGCFSTPEVAVKTIATRLIELRDIRSSGTPERMIVWKCGSSCAEHSPESVRKWISDVNLYYHEIARK